MNIGIIDADLLDKGTRHPNLALMKISAYHKKCGDINTFIGYGNLNIRKQNSSKRTQAF